MLARAHTFTIDGLHTRHVTVEVDVRAGLPAFTIVGLADAAVREARERMRRGDPQLGLSSFRRGGSPPTSRPATCRRPAPGSTSRSRARCSRPADRSARSASRRSRCSASSALDGALRAGHGTLAVAAGDSQSGPRARLPSPPRERTRRALVDGLEVAAVARLRSAVRVLGGGAGDPLARLRRRCARGAARERDGARPARRARSARTRCEALTDRCGRRPQPAPERRRRARARRCSLSASARSCRR